MADNEPIFDNDGALTQSFLLARGYCCGNGCRNCPYDYAEVKPDEKRRELFQSRAVKPEHVKSGDNADP